jgi:predicted transcriptional regulator
MLVALKEEPCSAEEVAQSTGLPLFRVRSGLRELAQAGLTSAKGDKYELSPEGKKLADSL